MSTPTDCATRADTAACLEGVSKTYKHFQLQQVHLELCRGTVMGLIGPNGAGKSTTMRILMGLVTPDQGTVSLFGQPAAFNDAKVKLQIGYFADDLRLYKRESIGWHMQFLRSLYPSWDSHYANQLLDRFGLLEQQPIKGLSHGQRVKALLLLILARHPRLLILDEPTNGLDPVAKREVMTELMRVVRDEDRTTLYSSHNTQDIEQISDSITFIDRGQVIASSNRDDFLERWRRIKVHAPETWSPPNIPGLRQESMFRSLRVFTLDQYREDVSSRLQASAASVEAVERMTLEEIFVSSVMRGRKESHS